MVDEIKAAGGEAVADAGSVADYEACCAMVQLAEETWGRLDIAICNAGVTRDREVDKMEEVDYDQTFGVHTKGSFNVVRHAWPLMAKQRYGRIVLTSSGAAFGMAPPAHSWLYSGAKAVMIGMVNALRYEGRDVGIQANAVMPAAFTAMVDGITKGIDEKAREERRQAEPPEHVAPATLYLCHEDCRDSGEVIVAESGLYGRAVLVKGPLLKGSSDLSKPQSMEWVRDHWDQIMALNARGEAEISDFHEMDGVFEEAQPVPFGRRSKL